MNDQGVVKTAFFIVFGFFVLLLVIISLLSIPLRTKAAAKSLTLSIKLQGEHKAYSTIKAQADIYNGPQKVTGNSAVTFTNTNGIFTGIMPLDANFDFAGFYAVFVKPEKYTGRIFCKTDITGKACTVPQMIFNVNGTAVNLADTVFLGGDTTPANGKVDAQDMSLIMKNLGKTNTVETDINGDGITNVVDYSLALYSLAQNAADDTITLQSPGTQPTVTATPSATATPQTTATPAPSSAPTATAAPTSAPTTAPTNTPTPTPTTAPTATPKPAQGQCNAVPPSLAGFMGCSTTPYTINSGTTSSCTSCAGISAKATCTCPSGTCTCNIPASEPPVTVSCSNGGTLNIVTCQ